MRFRLSVGAVTVLASLAVSSAVMATPRTPPAEVPPPASFDEQVERVLAALSNDLDAEGRAASRRSVSSPFAMFDRIGDAGPYYHPRGDLTAYEVRNGPGFVDLRFRLLRRPDTWNTATTGAVMRIDLAGSGPAIDYDVVVVSRRDTGLVVVVGPHGFQPDEATCVSRNVTDLGSNRFGYGYSARFRFDCIGGHRGFRTRMGFLYSWWPGDPAPTGDFVPNGQWTPSIRPA